MTVCTMLPCSGQLKMFLEHSQEFEPGRLEALDQAAAPYFSELTDDIPHFAEVFYLSTTGGRSDQPLIVPTLMWMDEGRNAELFCDALREVMMQYENRNFDFRNPFAAFQDLFSRPRVLVRLVEELKLDYGIERSYAWMEIPSRGYHRVVGALKYAWNHKLQTAVMAVGGAVVTVGAIAAAPEVVAGGIPIALMGWLVNELSQFQEQSDQMKIATAQEAYERAREASYEKAVDATEVAVSIPGSMIATNFVARKIQKRLLRGKADTADVDAPGRKQDTDDTDTRTNGDEEVHEGQNGGDPDVDDELSWSRLSEDEQIEWRYDGDADRRSSYGVREVPDRIVRDVKNRPPILDADYWRAVRDTRVQQIADDLDAALQDFTLYAAYRASPEWDSLSERDRRAIEDLLVSIQDSIRWLLVRILQEEIHEIDDEIAEVKWDLTFQPGDGLAQRTLAELKAIRRVLYDATLGVADWIDRDSFLLLSEFLGKFRDVLVRMDEVPQEFPRLDYRVFDRIRQLKVAIEALIPERRMRAEPRAPSITFEP